MIEDHNSVRGRVQDKEPVHKDCNPGLESNEASMGHILGSRIRVLFIINKKCTRSSLSSIQPVEAQNESKIAEAFGGRVYSIEASGSVCEYVE